MEPAEISAGSRLRLEHVSPKNHSGTRANVAAKLFKLHSAMSVGVTREDQKRP